MDSISYREYLAPASAIAREAGAIIMGYFTGGYTSARKEDNSPVTEADVAANRHIVAALSTLTPHIPIVAEEDETLADGGHQRFWLVDPLDGTKSFVKGEAQFSVNIGLVENGRPVLGVLYAPPQDMLYFGIPGYGAFRSTRGGTPEPIATRTPPKQGLVVVRSQSHPSARTEAYLKTLNTQKIIGKSSAMKFCDVAEGSADIYPRFGATMEWDTCAGQAILEAAGGCMETIDGEPFVYGKQGFRNPGFIAYGR